jgi:phage host-nuclease inhibitor protein Gam
MNDELVPAPDDAPDLEALPEKWKIVDHRGAEWAMVRYANAARIVADLDAERDAWIARVNEWHADAVKPLQNTLDWFDIHLQDYALRQRDESPRNKKGEPTVKTVSLVTGKITTTGRGETIDVVDEAAVIVWAETAKAIVDLVPEGVNATPWVDGGGVQRWIVDVADLGVIRTTKKLNLDALRAILLVVDHAEHYEGEAENQVKHLRRRVVGPDGERVPGVEVVPPTTRARVVPNNISEQKEPQP